MFLLTLILVPGLTMAQVRCELVAGTNDLRIQIQTQEIQLRPAGAYEKNQLINLLSEPDIQRFFLGNNPPEYAANAMLDRSKQTNGGDRDTFDGAWVVTYKNKPAGILMMSAISLEWLPPEIQSEFQKQSPSDLYLAVGYALKPEFRGYGVMSKAVNLAIEYAKNNLKAKYIFASANNLNTPSAKLLLKNGFQKLFQDEKRTKYILPLSE